METQTFIFFGQVGSGKGTQAKLLADFLMGKSGKETVYAGTGEGFRNLIKSDNYTAKLVKDILLRGELQPDFLTNAVFSDILIHYLTDQKHLLADGYPRTTAQSETFDQMMKFYQRKNIKIIYIELSEMEAMKRNLMRGRADDTEEGLRKRFNEYVNKVIPAMNYFKDKENYEIFTINGEQDIKKVQEDIISKLGFS